ncbi:aminotransferase class V-fold PLP-dependent enzyme [Herbidospora sp. RD11066]
MNDVRAEFPLLETCLYLNSNSTGAIPRGAERVLRNYWQTLVSWRDEVWDGWLAQITAYADAVGAFLNAPEGTVVTDLNLSTLLARIASSLDFDDERHKVVASNLEFPTVPFVWRGFARYGAVVEFVPLAGIVDAIDEKTVCVSVTHGAYLTGELADLEAIIDRAHQVGAVVIVDAYQTVGAVPIDVTALGVDFLLGGAHKWMCGASTAFLYVRPDLLGTLEPAATGWLAGDDPISFQPTSGFAPDARRMSGGTPLALGPMISRVGLDLLAKVGIDDIRRHSLTCTDRIIQRALADGMEVLTPLEESRRGGIVALRFPGDDRVHQALQRRGVICSRRGALRVAPHFYTTLAEVDAFMDAVDIERKLL